MVSDPTKLLFSTSHNVQKILYNSSTTITVPVDSGSIPVVYTPFTVLVHGLGYIPSGRVFYEPTPGQVWPLDNSINLVYGRFYFTTNALVLEMNNFTGSPASVKVYWRVYADQ